MKKSTKIILSSVLVFGMTSAVFAFGGGNHWKMDPNEKAEFVTERITKKLDLNEAQTQSLQVLADKMLEMMVEFKSHRSEQFDLVEKALSEPALDQQEVLQMIQQKTQLINDKAPQAIASLAGFLDSLDADQKAKLQELANDRMRHRHKD